MSRRKIERRVRKTEMQLMRKLINSINMSIKRIIYSVGAVMTALAFVQCDTKVSDAGEKVSNDAPVFSQELKIAYVDVDSLLANYLFYQDLSEELLRKEENSRLLLSEETEKLQKEIDEFNRKLQNNVFSSQERVNQEQNRLLKKQQSLQELNDKLSGELMVESNNNADKVSTAVNSFLQEYNKSKGYNLILSKATVMLADDSMNITADVIKGLNDLYKADSK